MRLVLTVFLMLCPTLVIAATDWNERDVERVKNLIQFALQCNANVGVIDALSVLDFRREDTSTIKLLGTYKQTVVGAALTIFKIPSITGGTFDAAYDLATERLTIVNFKISIRSGRVNPACLR